MRKLIFTYLALTFVFCAGYNLAYAEKTPTELRTTHLSKMDQARQNFLNVHNAHLGTLFIFSDTVFHAWWLNQEHQFEATYPSLMFLRDLKNKTLILVSDLYTRDLTPNVFQIPPGRYQLITINWLPDDKYMRIDNIKNLNIKANQQYFYHLTLNYKFKNLLNTRLNKTEAKKLFATYRFGCVDHGRDLIHEKCIKYEVPSPIRVSMHMRAYTSWLSGDIPIQNTGKTKKLSDFNMRKCRLKHPIDYKSNLHPDTGKKKKYSHNNNGNRISSSTPHRILVCKYHFLDMPDAIGQGNTVGFINNPKHCPDDTTFLTANDGLCWPSK